MNYSTNPDKLYEELRGLKRFSEDFATFGLNSLVFGQVFHYFRYGMSSKWVSEKLNLPFKLVTKLKSYLSILGFPETGKKKYYCNQDFFKVVDTEEKAYWLGFIYADGCITPNGVNILLKQDDSTHLEKFKKIIEAENKIELRFEKIKDKKTKEVIRIQPTCKIRLSSEIMRADLINLGCGPRKSLTLDFVPKGKVPEKLIHHFIRGYFDGDGSVSKYNDKEKWSVCFLSTDNFAFQLFAKLLERGFGIGSMHFRPHPTTRGMMYLNFINFQTMHQIKDFMYKDATVFLDRKKEIFDNMRESQHNHIRCQNDIESIVTGNYEWYSTQDIMDKTNNKYNLQRVQLTLRQLANDGFLNVKSADNGTSMRAYQWDEEAYVEQIYNL